MLTRDNYRQSFFFFFLQCKKAAAGLPGPNTVTVLGAPHTRSALWLSSKGQALLHEQSPTSKTC